MNSSKDRLIIYTSWQTYLLMLGLPIFLIALDYLSILMTNTTFGNSIFNVAIVIFLVMFILGSKILILSKGSIKSWPSLIFGKKILVHKIAKINAEVDIHLAYNSSGVAPVPTLHFIDSESKIIDKINFTTFGKDSLSYFLSKVCSVNSNILLNDSAKELLAGNGTLIKNEINRTMFYFTGILAVIAIVVFAMLGIVSAL